MPTAFSASLRSSSRRSWQGIPFAPGRIVWKRGRRAGNDPSSREGTDPCRRGEQRNFWSVKRSRISTWAWDATNAARSSPPCVSFRGTRWTVCWNCLNISSPNRT
ncbi:MAG: hypothetical protein MZV64_59680 [Ignavibacteriales bacterium]|nr:hypothetical protein [Ignavibacteriales bacterium]